MSAPQISTRLEGPHVILAMRGAVLATAGALLAWPLSASSGVLGAVSGSLLGLGLAERAAPSPLRTLAALAASVVAGTVGAGLASGIVETDVFGALLGAVPAYHLGQLMLWLSAAASIVFVLRFLANRHPSFAVLEVVAVAAAFVSGFAAHRQGMVSRPLSIGDFAWSRGIDPAMVLLAIGGVGTLLLAALLISERQQKRIPLHFGSLLLIAIGLFLFVRVNGLPAPEMGDGLGLTGKPEKREDEGDSARRHARDEHGGKSQRKTNPEDMKFRDDYSGGGDAPVAIVVLHDDYSPPSGVYYFRQSAQSQFNGNRLVRATRDDVDEDIVDRFPSEPLVIPHAPPRSRRRHDLETTVGLLRDHNRPFALDSPARVTPTQNPDPVRFQRTYAALSRVQTTSYEDMLGQRPGRADWSEEQWTHYTELPADPRYEELARKLVAKLPEEYRDDPLADALAIKMYLDKNGIYSLKSKHASKDDPVASFLFGDLTGYCVHFAHAATYLLRSLGIPARVAVGYAVEEGDRGSGSAIMLRGGNAHAWPEIYLENSGWTTVDLSPEQTLSDPLAPPDQTLQSMLGEMMRRRAGEEDAFAESRRFWPTWSELARTLAWLALLAIAVGLAGKIYRQAAPRFADEDDLYRLSYRAAADRLAEVGLRRGFGESREQFATRASPVTSAFGELTARHIASALGSESRGTAQTFRDLLRETRSEIDQRTGLGRRVLARLNPFAWLLVR